MAAEQETDDGKQTNYRRRQVVKLAGLTALGASAMGSFSSDIALAFNSFNGPDNITLTSGSGEAASLWITIDNFSLDVSNITNQDTDIQVEVEATVDGTTRTLHTYNLSLNGPHELYDETDLSPQTLYLEDEFDLGTFSEADNCESTDTTVTISMEVSHPDFTNVTDSASYIVTVRNDVLQLVIDDGSTYNVSTSDLGEYERVVIENGELHVDGELELLGYSCTWE